MIRNQDSDFNPTMSACKAFDKVLNCVKTSNLNFCLQLSPFSANISIKKSLIKDKAGFYLTPPVSDPTLTQSQNLENLELEKKVIELESTIQELKLRLSESDSNCQRATDTIHQLEKELFIKKENSESYEFDLKKSYAEELENKCQEINFLHEENNSLQDQRSSLQALQQQHKGQLQDLQRSLQSSKSAAKKLIKELKDEKLKHEKETKQIIKNFKSEVKSWRKSLGSERAKKIKVEKKLAVVENHLREYTSKNTKSILCQTNNNIDIPYEVTAPLPPIFGSQLCRKSKPILFMSRSVPNLSTLSWVTITEEEMLMDEAEQALNEQYDRQIDEFYKDAKNRTAAIRQLYEENAIGELFEDNW